MEYKIYKTPVRSVIIDDYLNYYRSSVEYETIEFGISRDNLVHYLVDKDAEPNLHKNMLVFDKTLAGIYVPRNTGIQMLHSERDIEGVIASPALFLDHVGDVDLTVKNPKSRLKLVLETKETTRINGELRYIDMDFAKRTYRLGGKFQVYKEAYESLLNETTLPPEISETAHGTRADYSRSRYSHPDIDTCIHFGLVCMTKTKGAVSLSFENLQKIDDNEIDSKDRTKEKIPGIDELSRKLDEAIRRENFEDAARYRDEIDRLEGRIRKSD